jgi:hypothetical protein
MINIVKNRLTMKFPPDSRARTPEFPHARQRLFCISIRRAWRCENPQRIWQSAVSKIRYVKRVLRRLRVARAGVV